METTREKKTTAAEAVEAKRGKPKTKRKKPGGGRGSTEGLEDIVLLLEERARDKALREPVEDIGSEFKEKTERDWTGDSQLDERPARRKKAAKKEPDWQDELIHLLNTGLILDKETLRSDYWIRDPETNVVLWKPNERDVWIQQYLKIRQKAGEVKPFAPNAVQSEYSRTCGKRNIVLKARQVGMTSYIAARFFVQTVTKQGALTMLVAHDREAAEEIFRIVHRFWDNLPEKLQKGPLKTSHSSARELVFPRLDSEFTVATADENAGRGRTIQNLHCTEVSRWGRNSEEALASLRAAVVPRGEIVLESTANGAWGTFYSEWQKAEETGYRKHFFPWWFEESYALETDRSFEMTAEEAELAAAHGLTRNQIAWRRQQWSTLRGLAKQEFAENAVDCFRASGECMFQLDVIEEALASPCEPIETHDNGRLSIWLPPQGGRKYVIGADCAGGGVEGDYSCAEVIDRESGTQCAELVGHYSQRDFANKLVELAKKYNSALLAVERNNHGSGVLAHVEHLKYLNVFRDDGQEGWLTSSASRPAMIAKMGDVLAEQPHLFRSTRLWNECRTFVQQANGTGRAAPGAHDDCVMAIGIALAVRYC